MQFVANTASMAAAGRHILDQCEQAAKYQCQAQLHHHHHHQQHQQQTHTPADVIPTSTMHGIRIGCYV